MSPGEGWERQELRRIFATSRCWRVVHNFDDDHRFSRPHAFKIFLHVNPFARFDSIMSRSKGTGKELILDLTKHLDKKVSVKFQGGREVVGILKGYDPLVNIVLDETVEYIRDPSDPYRLTKQTRNLGLTVCRGTAVMLVCPTEGMEEIANPFVQQD